MHGTAIRQMQCETGDQIQGRRFRWCRSVLFGVVSVFLFGPGWNSAGFAQDPDVRDTEFNWATHRSSPADLLIQRAAVLHDRKADLDAEQQLAWTELLDEVTRCRQALREDYPDDWTSRWESAFYRYADVRQAAWENGTLLIHRQQKKNPFRDVEAESTPTEVPISEYSLLADILDHPEDFVGKPVVFRGILRRPEPVAVGRTDGRVIPEGTTLSLGELRPLSGEAASFAVVHTEMLERTSGENAGAAPWPRNAAQLPVLVKGWVVKLWGDQRPLIYCDAVRELSLQPPEALIRRYAVSRRPIQTEESWLYFETLANQAALESLRSQYPETWKMLFPGDGSSVSGDSPQLAAARFLSRRLEDLLVEFADKARADEADLQQRLDTKQISSAKHEAEMDRLLYLVRERRRRYEEARDDPRQFDTFVDLFINPDVWQGQLVTLRGHVRHVVSYPGDHPEFHGRSLHELWLFTEDSQSNPAVIVTSKLPEEFPVDAPLIDQVSVTGCVFKQYVYRSQKSRRIAPLILAGDVQWTPTDSHLLSLHEDGHLSSGSDLVQRARAGQSEGPGTTALLLVGFLATLTVMILWGRAQRDRRDRRALMNRIAQAPEFESSLDGEYAPRLSDYTSGYDL